MKRVQNREKSESSQEGQLRNPSSWLEKAFRLPKKGHTELVTARVRWHR
jgi:hypothetical protein